VVKRALPPDAATADVLSAYSPEQGASRTPCRAAASATAERRRRARAGFQEMSVEELCARLVGPAPPRLLDVRSAAEYAQRCVRASTAQLRG
jgi:hypothetical protein